jgi:hypothetical protein
MELLPDAQRRFPIRSFGISGCFPLSPLCACCVPLCTVHTYTRSATLCPYHALFSPALSPFLCRFCAKYVYICASITRERYVSAHTCMRVCLPQEPKNKKNPSILLPPYRFLCSLPSHMWKLSACMHLTSLLRLCMPPSYNTPTYTDAPSCTFDPMLPSQIQRVAISESKFRLSHARRSLLSQIPPFPRGRAFASAHLCYFKNPDVPRGKSRLPARPLE